MFHYAQMCTHECAMPFDSVDRAVAHSHRQPAVYAPIGDLRHAYVRSQPLSHVSSVTVRSGQSSVHTQAT